jgi:glycogen phosphorylase
LPRHLELIYKINFFLIENLRSKVDSHTLSLLSLVEEYPIKQIRFSNLCFVTSHLINGLSDMHVFQLKLDKYKELNQEFPERILSISSGVSPRRWLHCSNPLLDKLLTDNLAGSDSWI